MREIHDVICRVCHISCSMKVEIEDGVPVKAYGAKDNPVYFGYSCVKGRQIPAITTNPQRLLHAVKRTPYGRYERIAVEQAYDEIAVRVKALIDEFGPRSIADYSGTFGAMYLLPEAMARAFMDAIGSPMHFTNGTIDQPGKPIAMALHGRWGGGLQSFDSSDVCLQFGGNPVLSKWGAIPPFNPAKRLRDARLRGMKLIVVDPRRTETSGAADIHLQCRPGKDPVILAGMIHWIIANGRYDHDFVNGETQGFAELRRAVAPFTPARAAAEAGLDEQYLIAAARVFAEAKRGYANAGTGSNMAAHGTLVEYLVLCLNTICGRWLRAGERVPNPFVLIRENRGKAQAMPRQPAYGFGEQLRVRGLTNTAAGMPAAVIPAEILTPGPGQVKALFVNGGNPVENMPDQVRMLEAYKALSLSVALDCRMSASARVSDYVFGARILLEEPACSIANEGMIASYGLSIGCPEPFGQYQPKLIEPPAGSEVIAEWELYYALAQRLGLNLRIRGRPVDMEQKPTSDQLLDMYTRGSRIPLAEVRNYPAGKVFDDPSIVVLPKDEGYEGRLELGAPEMMQELVEVANEPASTRPFSLVSCRLHDIYNSAGRDIPVLAANRPYNPLFVHPDDLAGLGLRDGDMVQVTSDHAGIIAVVEADPGIRRGVVALSHGFGGVPEEGVDVHQSGSSSSRLIDGDRGYDRFSGIPRMSAIPVTLTPLVRGDSNQPVVSAVA